MLPKNRLARSTSALVGRTVDRHAIELLSGHVLTRLYTSRDIGLLLNCVADVVRAARRHKGFPYSLPG